MSPFFITVVTTLAIALAWSPIAWFQLGKMGLRRGQTLAFGDKLQLIASLYLVIPLVLACVSYWLGVSPAAWGLRPGTLGVIQVVAGLGIGAVGIALLFGLQVRLGWMVLSPVRLGWRELVLPLAIGLFVAGVEELLFRGFLFSTLLGYGPWTAAVVSSLVFAFLHLVWQLDDLKGAALELPGLFAMGLVLVLACLLAGRSIHLAWGLHAGWVWGITLVDSHRLATPTGRVGGWITGLGGKPLAGLLGAGFLFATGVLLYTIHYLIG